MHDVSLMPQTSQMGSPSASKNSSSSTGAGAAPQHIHCTWSRPSFARTAAPTAGSARAASASCGPAAASSAARIFSHTRGTEPKTVGRTCARTDISCVASGTGVSAFAYVMSAE